MFKLEKDLVSIPEKFPRIFAVELREDDPAKCTSAKMIRFHLASPLPLSHISREAIVLNPFSPEVLLNSDRTTALRGGFVIIDCSWAKATGTFKRSLKGHQRRLPTLMAGNPTNYSKLNSLSSVEAASATAYILGFRNLSERLLSLYKWGETFFSLNSNALIDYSLASGQDEMKKIEADYFPQISSNPAE
jgi:pre-rRNA-processing protein TSR3